MRYVLVLLFLTIGSWLFAADFVVTETLTPQPTSLALQKNPRTDDNGDPCGLIIIYTDISDLKFNSSLTPVDVVKKTGEYWVYLSAGDSYLKFEKAGYASLRYNLPLTIQQNTVYTMRLGTKATGIVVTDADSKQLLITLNQPEVYISKNNGPPLLTRDKTVPYKLPAGEYTFRFSKPGFQDETRTLRITEDQTLSVDLKSGASATKAPIPGYVTINSDPAGADVYLNDQKVGITPLNADITAGTHTLSIRKSMYETYNGSFTLAETETKELPLITLKTMYGFYAITANPSGAKIYLDNKEVGTTQVKRTRIESGNHTLRVETTDKLYHPEEKPITVKNGDDLSYTFDLKPAFGKLEVRSIPESGAKVWLDDREVGVTPYVYDKLPSASYRLRVEKELWTGSEEQITVLDGQTTLREIALAKNFAEVSLTADGCEIYQNDVLVGKDRYTGRLAPGQYAFQARKGDKYHEATFSQYLAAGETVNQTLTPEPITGSLAIESKPFDSKGAEIWLNGNRRKETTPAVLETIIGSYTVTVRHPKFLEQSQTIALKEGGYQKLMFELQSYQGSYLAKAHAWQTTKWISLGTSLATIGLGSFSYMQSNSYYDLYQKAGSSAAARDYRTACQAYEQLTAGCLYFSPLPVALAIYSAVRQHRNQALADNHK